MKGHEKEMDNMKETELNAHVRKWNADNLEEKTWKTFSTAFTNLFFRALVGYPRAQMTQGLI